jgi:hypothetical protein
MCLIWLIASLGPPSFNASLRLGGERDPSLSAALRSHPPILFFAGLMSATNYVRVKPFPSHTTHLFIILLRPLHIYSIHTVGFLSPPVYLVLDVTLAFCHAYSPSLTLLIIKYFLLVINYVMHHAQSFAMPNRLCYELRTLVHIPSSHYYLLGYVIMQTMFSLMLLTPLVTKVFYVAH